MVLDYEFTILRGPVSIDEERGEEYYSGEDEYEYAYEIGTREIVDAFVGMYSSKKKPVEEQVTDIYKELVEGQRYEDEAEMQGCLLELKEKKDLDVYDALEYVLGDIDYFADTVEDDLTEYFRDEAYEKFTEDYS